MNILTRLAAVLLAAATISSSTVLKSQSNAKDGNFELLILHNNDMHARFEQTSQLSGACTIADREAGKCYGGFPRVAHVVKEARRKAASGEGPPVLYLNAGDTYTGTAWFTIYKWKIAAEFINALQPDAVSLGNNDLENGSAELSPFLDSLNTTILATNVILSNPVKSSKLVSSAIYLLGETKVGLVAYLTPEMVDSNGTIEYIDEVIALKEEVSKLQAQDTNIIIALGHANLETDLEVAREVEGIDLIIAGHKNTFYWNGTTADVQILNEALVVTQESGKNVPIISSYTYNKYLGKVNIEFETNGEITSYHVEPVVLDETILQDPTAVDIENKLGSEFVSRSEEVVGQTAVVLDGETCKIAECNLGNLITDAMIYYYAVNFEGERWTDAPIAILPGGDIAASISPQNRPASVTRGDLMTVLPIESHLVAITMNGTVLEKLLEHSVAEYSLVNPTENLLQFSGIRIAYDMNKPVGSRIETAVVRCWDCFVPEFYSIDDWRSYKILMPAALADGAYGYSMLEGLSKENIVYDEITCTMEYLALRSPVYPEVAERIHINNFQEEVEEEIHEPELPPEEEDINEPQVPPEEEEEGNEPELPPEEVECSPQPDSASSLYSTIPVLIITLITLVVS